MYFARGIQDYQHSRIPLWVTFHSNGLNQAPVRMRGDSANSPLLSCDYTRRGTLQDVMVNSSPATHNNRDIFDLPAVLIELVGNWKLSRYLGKCSQSVIFPFCPHQAKLPSYISHNPGILHNNDNAILLCRIPRTFKEKTAYSEL